MFCEIPESRRRRSADISTIANGYFISISNDGLNFTEELAVISFDTRCYNCNVTDFWCAKEVIAIYFLFSVYKCIKVYKGSFSYHTKYFLILIQYKLVTTQYKSGTIRRKGTRGKRKR